MMATNKWGELVANDELTITVTVTEEQRIIGSLVGLFRGDNGGEIDEWEYCSQLPNCTEHHHESGCFVYPLQQAMDYLQGNIKVDG